MLSVRHKWIAARVSEAFSLPAAEGVAFLERRDTAAQLASWLEGEGNSCIYVYYQPRDVRSTVRLLVAWRVLQGNVR